MNIDIQHQKTFVFTLRTNFINYLYDQIIDYFKKKYF